MFRNTLSSVLRFRISMVRWRSPAAAVSHKDPVQQLFLDKLREYVSKSEPGKLVEPNDKVLKELKSELEKLERHYGGGKGVDMTTFPELKFEEPYVEPINEADAAAAAAAARQKKKDALMKKNK